VSFASWRASRVMKYPNLARLCRLGCDDLQAAVDEHWMRRSRYPSFASSRICRRGRCASRIMTIGRQPDAVGAGIESLLNLNRRPKVTSRATWTASLVKTVTRSSALEKSFLNGFRFEAVHCLTSRNSSPKIVLSRAALVADERAGSAPTLVGMVQDITPLSRRGASVREGGDTRHYCGNLEAPLRCRSRLSLHLFQHFFGLSMRQLYGVDPRWREGV